MSVHYHSCKDYVVADSISRLFMGSVAHVEEERKNNKMMFTGLLAREFAL